MSAFPSLSRLSPAASLSSLASAAQRALPSRDLFVQALSQHARLLNIVTPLADAALVAERMHGREALSSPYRFEVDCLSGNAHLSLARFIGEEVTLKLLLVDGSRRNWHGLVTAAAQLGADGGLARYRLTVEPWFALLAHRRNSRIFQDQTVEEILTTLFADYPQARFTFAHTATLPVRSLTTQYRESDLAFAARLLAEAGLSYRFEHEQGEASSAGQGGDYAHTRHSLVIFDAGSPVPVCAEPFIRYHRVHATEAGDTIRRWHTRQEVLTNAVTRASWDYKQLLAPAGQADMDATAFGGAGEVPTLEDYDATGVYRYQDASAAERAAMLRAQYLALATQAHRIEGSARALDVGHGFTVLQHPHYSGDSARFNVLAIEHELVDNVDSQARASEWLAGEREGGVERGAYRNRAVCVAASLPLVPQPLPRSQIAGLQTALVVGAPDATPSVGTHSERDGRIKIQFPWQRGDVPLPGGLDSARERASGDHTNGTWVRVAESLAGPNWGSSFTPRVGSEVLVDFIAGDPDRPLVVAQLYNGQDAPPWPAGEGSAANHPGVLAGLHAPTLDGGGWSQWQIDDATGQLRTRLATSFATSQLNLGYLIHQTPGSSQRGQYRGQGFELRTDGWSITRAASGMLFTTTARANANSIQLDAQEAAAQLQAAVDTASRLSEAASQSQADALTQASRIDAFRQLIHPEDTPPDGTGAPDRSLKPFAAPAIALDAPSSIVLATPQSATLFAGEHLAATVQGYTQLTAQHTASLVSGKELSFYTHANGIKAIAANAPLTLQAHDGPLEVLADQDVTITSSNDEIHVLANSKIVLLAGQSSITLEGGNITFACPGKFTVKGSNNVMAGGGSAAAGLIGLPSGTINEVASAELDANNLNTYDMYFLVKHSESGRPMEEVRYRITLSDGKSLVGVTNENGLTEKISARLPLMSKIEVPFYDSKPTNNPDDAIYCFL